MLLYNIIVIALILLVSLINKLSNKNKFRLKMLTSGLFNKLVLLVLIILVFLDDYLIGTLLLLLLNSIIMLKTSDVKEGFRNYWKSKKLKIYKKNN